MIYLLILNKIKSQNIMEHLLAADCVGCREGIAPEEDSGGLVTGVTRLVLPMLPVEPMLLPMVEEGPTPCGGARLIKAERLTKEGHINDTIIS